jgi:hypothetical protein
MDHIIIEPKTLRKWRAQCEAVLAVVDDESELQHRDVYPYVLARSDDRRPILWISPETAEMLLATTGSSLAEVDAFRASLQPASIQLTGEGATVEVGVPAELSEAMLDEAYVNVIGVIAGQGYMMGMQEQIIMVSAYYDGVGADPRGVVYPGANDNASGVATMWSWRGCSRPAPISPTRPSCSWRGAAGSARRA